VNAEIEKLLTLLDDEESLRNVIGDLQVEYHIENGSELAFRLRDEIVATHWMYWHKAMTLVRDRDLLYSRGTDTWADYAQPKHFIVAAMVARLLKEQA